ncbi:hypothetical protein VULLAG_LOCUS17149 [Vulpes lagopus]
MSGKVTKPKEEKDASKGKPARPVRRLPFPWFPSPARVRAALRRLPAFLLEPKMPVTSATPGEKGVGGLAAGGAWGCTTFPPSSWNCRPASASSLFHSPSGRTVVALRATRAAAAPSAGNSAACYRPAAYLCECMCVRVRECAYVCCAGATW